MSATLQRKLQDKSEFDSVFFFTFFKYFRDVFLSFDSDQVEEPFFVQILVVPRICLHIMEWARIKKIVFQFLIQIEVLNVSCSLFIYSRDLFLEPVSSQHGEI